MTREELIKILEDYEIFVDDDFGGSYKSIIAYTPDKKVSRAHTPIGTLKIIDTFEKLQKEKQELKEQLSNSHQINAQQKEFIEWLEQNIENEEYCYLAQNPSERCRKDVFEETLSKYKEIVGGNNDQ